MGLLYFRSLFHRRFRAAARLSAMVLTVRSIAGSPVNPKAYEVPSDRVLEHLSGERTLGLLKQIGQLSDFAADIFANLLKDATATSQRVAALSSRVGAVEA